MSVRRWLLASMGGVSALVALLCVLQVLSAAGGIALALLMRGTIDAAVVGDAPGFRWQMAWFACVLGGLVALRCAVRFVQERARASAELKLRGRGFAAVLGQDLRAAESWHSGAFMSRLTSDVAVVADGFVSLPPSVCSMAVRVVGVLAALVLLVPVLAVVFLSVGCVLGAASLAMRGWLKRLHARMQDAESDMRCYMQECLESLLVVRAFGAGEKVRARAEELMECHRAARLRKADASNAGSTGLNLAVQGCYALGFLWCCGGILQGTVSYGTLMAVIQLIGQLQSPFASMGGTFSRYAALLASAERLRALEAGSPASPPPSSGGRSVCNGKPTGEAASSNGSDGSTAPSLTAVELDRVTFRFSDQCEPVLKGCSLRVGAGEFVALRGASGEGKSTAMKVLLGAFVPQEGRAVARFADGSAVPCSDLPAGVFAYVPQGASLMAGTVAEAVALSGAEAQPDMERVRRACRAACADTFIGELPQGYQTRLGEHGAGLSGGQLQRLAIARAVYGDAPVLLLDEATSALDEETERCVLASLRALPGRMALVATHRPAALAVCDRVLTMEDGFCVENG